MLLNNKKAVIGTTLTWIFAIFIIIFVLVIYFITLGLLSKANIISQSSVKTGNNQFYDLNDYQNIISFISMNKKVINDWADSDLVISRTEFVGEIPEDKKKLYDDVFNSYNNFIKNTNYKEPYFYIRTEKKEMQIRKSSGTDLKLGSWSIKNPTSGDFYYNMEENKLEGDLPSIHRLYFSSNGGNLVMIIFYDESKIYAE